MSATGRGGERSEADFYRTPAWTVHRFLERCQLPGGDWLDLGAGEGDIIRAVQSFCDQPRGYDIGARWTAVELRAQCRPMLEEVADHVVIANAISATKRDVGGRAKFAVSCGNPPFRHAIDFIHQSLRLARWTALLLRLDFLAGAERQTFMREHPPDVYVVPDRISFTGDGGTDSTEHAWFVWNPKHRYRRAGRIEVLDTTPLPVRKAQMLVPLGTVAQQKELFA